MALEDYTDEIFMSIRNSFRKVILGLGFDLDREENTEFINSVGIDKVFRSKVFLDEISIENVSVYYEEIRRLRERYRKIKERK